MIAQIELVLWIALIAQIVHILTLILLPKPSDLYELHLLQG